MPSTFDQLEPTLATRFDVPEARLPMIARDVVRRVRAESPAIEHHQVEQPELRAAISAWNPQTPPRPMTSSTSEP